MKIENQVCSKKQGILLEQLGISHKPLLCYCCINNGVDDHMESILPTKWNLEGLPELSTTWVAPAYNVAELGEMLQAYTGIGHSFLSHFGNSNWCHTWTKNGKSQPIISCMASEAQARAEMLIHLLENDLITPEEVNQRLKQ